MTDVTRRGRALLDAGDERQVRWLKRAITLVLVAGLLAFVVRGADLPADPHFDDERPADEGASLGAGAWRLRR